MLSQQGWLLWETLLVITLMTLFSTVTLPIYQQYQQQWRWQQQLQGLLAFLVNMRTLANQQNRYYQIIALSLQQLCVLPTGWRDSDNFCQQHPHYRFRLSTSLQVKQLIPNDLGFYGQSSSGQAGHILLQQGNWQALIILSGRGRLRACLLSRHALSAEVSC